MAQSCLQLLINQIRLDQLVYTYTSMVMDAYVSAAACYSVRNTSSPDKQRARTPCCEDVDHVNQLAGLSLQCDMSMKLEELSLSLSFFLTTSTHSYN